VACARTDIVAVVQSRQFHPEEIIYLSRSPCKGLSQIRSDAYADTAEQLPTPRGALNPSFVGLTSPDPEAGLRIARSVAGNAYVPESGFRVGCIVETDGGVCVPGVNVENKDWNRVLCAERNAVGTTLSYALGAIKTVYLASPDDTAITPCGACRQVLSELAVGSTLWMDRGEQPAQPSDPLTLLPGSFTGRSIRKNPR